MLRTHTDLVLFDVDESLRELFRTKCGLPSSIEIVFEAPTRDWASRRSGPAVDVFLYDIRENLDRRQQFVESVRDGDFVTGRVPPTRWFNCSYLVTAWTQRPDDEHRLLGGIIGGLLTTHSVPPSCLRGQLATTERVVYLTLGRPPSSERSISDIWSALGGELKPSLDLVVTVPFEPEENFPVGPPVMETTFVMGDGNAKRVSGFGRSKPPEQPEDAEGIPADTNAPSAAAAPMAPEELSGGTPDAPGRRFRFAVHEPNTLPRKESPRRPPAPTTTIPPAKAKR